MMLALGLKLLGLGKWLWKWAVEPLHLTMPFGLWFAIGLLFWSFWWAHGIHAERAGRAQVQATIDKPVTGWAARLKTCHESQASLQSALDTQNAAMTKRSGEATAALATSSTNLRRIAPQVRAFTTAAAAALRPLTTSDRCARMDEVDARFLESLK